MAYTPEQMFDLVADVERYPEFLPLCECLDVRRRHRAGASEVLVAVMGVGYKSIRETFTTRVALDPGALRIDVAYLDGPFRRLVNHWQFLPRPGGCEVAFFIDYEFKSMLLALLVGAVFDQAFRRFTDAFEARAQEIYGPSRGREAIA
jgi:coenzyme Q-binding protein COQ10